MYVNKARSLVHFFSFSFFMLQETKLQLEHVNDELRNLLGGYKSFWSCSTVKKGYSGTVSGLGGNISFM